MTFSVTFLGHQGWLIRTDTTALLLDPLLCESFGALHGLQYRVWPPRVLDLAAFPKIDAVILSHEHDDHFDLPSLARLDRKIPIFLSSRSSSAARAILAQLGFGVHPLAPGQPAGVGDLIVLPFTGEHVAVNCSDEWDALPMMIRDRAGDGSFFTMVDITMLPGHVEWAKIGAPQPGLVTWTNNALDWSHMADFLQPNAEGTEHCLMKMGTGHKTITTAWGKPAAMLMCAGGFSFDGDRAWLNQRVFCVDTQAVCKKLGSVYPDEKFFATLPGQTFVLRENRLLRVDGETKFLKTAPRASWPVRGSSSGARGPAPDYGPATGKRELSADDAARLPAGLDALAAAMVGGLVFRGLCSLLAVEAGERRGTVAFVLRREGAESLVYEYDPTGCRFVPGVADARASYIAGLECWASDFAAVLHGELSPIALTFARARVWNALPERFRFDVFEELYRVSHPLRRPDAYLRSYERIVRGLTSPA